MVNFLEEETKISLTKCAWRWPWGTLFWKSWCL